MVESHRASEIDVSMVVVRMGAPPFVKLLFDLLFQTLACWSGCVQQVLLRYRMESAGCSPCSTCDTTTTGLRDRDLSYGMCFLVNVRYGEGRTRRSTSHMARSRSG